MEPDDVYLAGLDEETRRPVVVVSVERFNRLADRVIVVPDLGGPPDEVPFPWRVAAGDSVFAADFVRAIPSARLLERVDRVPADVIGALRRAIGSVL